MNKARVNRIAKILESLFDISSELEECVIYK